MIRLLITSGRGPAECRIALAKALVVMAREADAAGLDLDVAQGPNLDGWGPSSAIAVVTGPNAAQFTKSWAGSLQWVSQSPLRPMCKRKNWFAGVFELPQAPSAPGSINLAEVRFEAFRAGGPGGQHQNKTESAVRAVHIPSGLAVVARDGRSQHRNKAIALDRLATLLRLSAELSSIAGQHEVHLRHDMLERGNPVRRFKGSNFEPV